jgi:hypothetical protein
MGESGAAVSKAKRLHEIARNDVPACEAYYEAYGVTSNEMHIMVRLQNDPEPLLEIMKRWKAKPSPGARSRLG